MNYKQYLNEEWIDRIKGKVFKKQSDVFINPTRKELMSISDVYGGVRGFVFVKTGKVIIFSAEVLHTEIEYTDIVPYSAYDTDNVVPVIIYTDGKITPSIYDPNHKAFKKVNKILKSLKTKISKVNTFVHI